MEPKTNPTTQKGTIEIKQAFLSNAISDISSYIQLSDTKVSIIMAAIVALIAVFVFGILTIRGHSSNIGYKSKWFLPQSTKEYSFDAYKRDVQLMDDEDIIDNMTAELYKLNDINRQKLKTNKWVIRSFSATLISAAVICVLLAISAL